MSPPRAVHQLLAALSYGDAIGNEALAIQAHLRDAGYDSQIFAEKVDPRMSLRARPLWEYREVSAPETVCLFHFSIGSAAGPYLHQRPDRVVAIYHNITPAAWFVGFHHHLARLCHHGRRELRAFASRAELGLADSEYNRRDLVAAGFQRTAVLPIVLDLAAYDQPHSEVVRRLYRDGRTNILFVGRIIPKQRVEDLIRVFAVYQRHVNPLSRLLLVGDYRGHERYYSRLMEMARQMRLDEVVFLGHVAHDELLACYGIADLFLCLSEHEGYCVPLLEAMVMGVPVLAYDAGAVAETMGGGGVLLQQKSPELVAELIDRTLTDPALRRSILASQARVVDRLRALDFRALLIDRLAPVLEQEPR